MPLYWCIVRRFYCCASALQIVLTEKEEIALYTPSALLDAVIKVLEHDQGEVIVSTWFNDAEAIAIKNGRLIIYTPNEVKRETMQKYYSDNVARAAQDLMGEPIEPLYLCGENELALWRTISKILRNEKYTGGVILQKSYVSNVLDGKQKRNDGQIPKYYIENTHPAIIDQADYERLNGKILPASVG